jgi:hypothetical protein
MSETRRRLFSGWARAGISGAALGLMLLMSGDRARAVTTGIDPLDILKLQVRPNVIVVLDSSGSMREGLTSPPIQLGDMHARSKLKQAKDVLNSFIANNQTRVSFQFGRYNQPNGTTSLANSGANRFLYSTTNALAAGIQINPGGSGTSTGRIKRDRCTTVPVAPGSVCGDTVIDVDGTAVHLFHTGRFFNGQTVRYTSGGTFCSTSPASPVNGANPATLTLQLVASCGGADTGAPLTVTFDGPDGDWGNPTSACQGFFSLVDLQPCNNFDQISLIAPFLRPSMLINANGTVGGYTEDASFNIATEPTFNGIRAGGFTPIAETIADIKTYFNDYYNGGPLLPAGLTPIISQNPKQRSFLIFVTDGDDTCSDTGVTDTSDNGAADETNPANQRALRAAYKAQLLDTRLVGADPASAMQTFLLLFGTGASKNRGDWIAYGGSGMIRATTGAGNATRWATIPTPAQVSACTTCRPAFAASNAQDLADQLESIINQVIGSGEFSSSAPVVGTVFELIVDPNPLDTTIISPLNPTTRYNERINILYQSTFDLPDWEGRLFAFRNDGSFQVVATTTNTLGIWEAGQTLHDKVTTVLDNTNRGHGLNEFTFAELHGGATVRNIGTSSALIKRRIFTSNGNGTFTRAAVGTNISDPQFDSSNAAGSNLVALWPPNQTGLTSGIADIDPAVGTVGPLDAALGIASLSYAQLQGGFGACAASTDPGYGPAPAACDFVANSTLATNTALKEAREILLAFDAGAGIDQGTDSLPARTPATATPPNALLFSSRGWLLADSQLAPVAVATPPLQFSPSTHVSEFILYRDGRRDASGQGINELNIGFGLRNPDFDNTNPMANLTLKPSMTVVYFGANDMVHAFRAGPQCTGGNCATGEQGSEELWGFIPFDQLHQAQDLIGGQQTNPHFYMIAAAMRLASVFIPDADGYNANGAHFNGRWRTVLFFGRGPGGKYLTAIDVTSPGAFTVSALDTNPPWLMWSRGNPDTVDGTAAGAAIHNATDQTLFADMGETWSYPAVGSVDVSVAGCPVAGAGSSEFRVFVGSGYGDTATNPNEGKRFYQLDAITGNVCQSSLLPNGTTTYIPDNALVAGPSGFNPKAQDPPGATTRDTRDFVTRIYQPDIHGRVWRFSTQSGGILLDAGPAQPFGHSVALLKIQNNASVFVESGDDTRVPDSVGPFKAYGVTDNQAETVYAPAPLGTTIPGFPFNLDTNPPSANRIRGTVQPATFFNANSQPRVFFAGTRFNPAGTASCVSSFDTILFAVSGNNGNAVYDFSGDNTADLYTVIQGNKTTGLISGGGSLIVGESGALANAPTPTPNPSPTPTPPPPSAPQIKTSNLRTNSPVCRTP